MMPAGRSSNALDCGRKYAEGGFCVTRYIEKMSEAKDIAHSVNILVLCVFLVSHRTRNGYAI